MLRNIQALRALAALLVVVVHLERLAAPLGFGHAALAPFAAGVDLFFVISGFIMVYTTARRPQRPARFLANRLMRIAPLYWALTLALFALALAAPGLLGTTRADGAALLRSLAFIPGERGDGTLRPILFVGWSLNLEMAFYLVFAACLNIADLRRRVAAGVAVLAGLVCLGLAWGDRMPAELRFLTQPILLEFGAGMALGVWYVLRGAGWPSERRPGGRAAGGSAIVRRRLLAGSAALAGTGLIAAAWVPPALARAMVLPPALLPALWLVALALRAEAAGQRMAARPVQALGAASYALYLSHPFVTQGFALVAQRLGWLDRWTAAPLMLAALACAAVVSVIVHRGLEQPLTEMVRRLRVRGNGLGAMRHGRLERGGQG